MVLELVCSRTANNDNNDNNNNNNNKEAIQSA